MDFRNLMFVVLAVLPAAALAAPKSATVAYSPTVPVVDGHIEDDPAWREVPWNGDFTILRKPDAPNCATRFKALYTADALYLAVECEEKNVGKMRFEERPVEFWLYDVTELFFEPMPGEVLHMIFSAHDSKNEQMPGATLVRTKGQTAWAAKSRIGTDRWTTEYLLPLALINVDPSAAGVTRPFNICRCSTPDGQFSTWNPTQQFASQTGFGRLVFSPAPADAASRVAALARRPHPIALLAKWQSVRADPFWRETLAANPAVVAELETLAAKPDLGGETVAFDDRLNLLDSRNASAEASHRARVSTAFFGHP